MIVVVDASVLITLARVGRLDLLRRIAGAVNVPDAVYHEVVEAGRDRPGSAEVAQAQWISRRAVRDQVTVARLRERLDDSPPDGGGAGRLTDQPAEGAALGLTGQRDIKGSALGWSAIG